MIELKQLNDNVSRPSFEELLRESWQQNWTNGLAEEIVQWRYYDRPAGATTWVAVEDGRCVGMLDSMLRPYLLNGRRVLVRETADWYCSPGQRAAGIGLRLLLRAAGQPEPVFVLGGSNHTLDILPKLHWTVLPSAAGFIFPLKLRGFAANMIRRRWWEREAMARWVPRFLPAKRPHRIASPPGHGQVEIMTNSNTLKRLPVCGDGLVQLFEPDHWAWMTRMPSALAQPLGLAFYLDREVVGFSLSQIEPSAAGLDAKIVFLHCGDNALGWVISETTNHLADRGVGFIRCCVSTPAKIDALTQVGYIKSRDVPCHWTAGKSGITPKHLDVGYLRGDDAMPFQALRGRRLGGSRV